MRTVAVVGVLVAVSACGAADVTESSEYTDLLDDHEALAAELEDAQTQLADSDAQLDEIDDQLAVAEAARTEAEDQVAEGDAIRSDFADYLAVEFETQAGLTGSESECVGDALLEDAEARSAYLLLLESGGAPSEEAGAAYDLVIGVLEGCDVDVPDGGPTATPAPPEELLDVLGDVEVIGVGLPTLTATDPAADVAVGTPAPVLVGAGYDGVEVRVDAAADGPTMVVFLAHWCPHCNAEIPRLNELRDTGAIPEGVNIVAVSTAVNPDRANFPPDTWLAEMGWTFPVLVDGIDFDDGFFVGSAAYGVSGVPFTTLIDANGDVAERWAGERDAAEIAAALAALAAAG